MLLAIVAVGCACLGAGFVFGRVTLGIRTELTRLQDERAAIRGRSLVLAPMTDIRPTTSTPPTSRQSSGVPSGF